MLILTRRPGEDVVIGDNELIFSVLKVHGNQVRVGVNTEHEASIHRREIYERADKSGIVRLQRGLPSARRDLLERIAALTSELCESVDLAEADIGGARPARAILGELGPLCDTLEKMRL